jgi:transposase InsO family protein
VIRLPPMSPNLNAYAERFVRSIKDECLDRMIFVGQGSLRRAVAEYMTHYHAERNHQGLDNPCASPWNIELLLPRGGMMQSFENLDVRDREQDQRCFGRRRERLRHRGGIDLRGSLWTHFPVPRYAACE